MPTSKPSSSSVAIGHITGLGSNVSTFLATPSSANLASAMTDETGSTNLAFATSPTLVTPALGTPASGVLTNCTGTASGLTAGTVTNGVYTTTTQTISGDKTFSSATVILSNLPDSDPGVAGKLYTQGSLIGTESVVCVSTG